MCYVLFLNTCASICFIFLIFIQQLYFSHIKFDKLINDKYLFIILSIRFNNFLTFGKEIVNVIQLLSFLF